MDDFCCLQNEGVSGKAMEKNEDGQALGVRNKRTATGLESVSIANEDGMKTHEEIKTYDPIANTMDNPLQNKQGVGSSGYDYSNLMTDQNRE